ncbi:hypothetical protein [Bacillus sp. AFS053548]|uniref:DUF7660 family protein n=1 Tax=Bacillus sp. AFS053548 TaxID=2033505 RepID=UPI000BFCD63E|nr:hypothetical protein [Bacillus sp. AFS053548]PGM58127.1 hypothetical protein CN946_06370 [Bacillus sp. AFS053548]
MDNEDEWENITLEAYIEAMEAWKTDSNKIEIPDTPNWKVFALILLSGRFYEYKILIQLLAI